MAHHHAHSHAPAGYGRAFALGVSLNLALVAVQALYGWLAGSLALLADAGHNLGDVMGLLVAWGATVLTGRVPTPRRTYGLRRASIYAAVLNGLFLMLASGAIALEALRRLRDPEPVAGLTVAAVAGAGLLVNGFTAMLFMRGRETDLNIRGAFLHMAADAGVSLGVLLAAVGIWATGWTWLDPLAGLLVVAAIVWSTWGLLREALDLAMDAVPRDIDIAAVRECLLSLPGVCSVHDLHVWAMSTTENALTAHLVVPGGASDDSILARACGELHDRFGIHHATLQVEHGDGAHPCHLEDDHVV